MKSKRYESAVPPLTFGCEGWRSLTRLNVSKTESESKARLDAALDKQNRERLLVESVYGFCRIKRLLDSLPPSRGEREKCRISGPPEGFRHQVRHL